MGTRTYLALGAAALALASGCTSASRACTAMGGDSGVTFDLSALPTTAPLPWRATPCVGDVCADQVVDSTGSFVQVVDAGLDGDPATARLSVVAADGAVLADSTAQVLPQRVDVNGGGCGPIVWQAGVVVGPDGTLSAAGPSPR